MTAAVFLVDDLAGEQITLTGPEGHHAAAVRRVRVGESVELVDGRGTRASCTVKSVGRDVVGLSITGRTWEPVPSPRLVLVQALAKGDRGELAVELATELGIDEIVPWAAARCVVKWEGERGSKALARWRSTAREAAKQSRRCRLPEVAELHNTARLLLRIGGSTALVLHEAASQPLSGVELSPASEVLIVVGPEGGLTDEEVSALSSAGGRVVRLGPSVLRTSTAGAAAVAVVSALTSRWGEPGVVSPREPRRER